MDVQDQLVFFIFHLNPINDVMPLKVLFLLSFEK